MELQFISGNPRKAKRRGKKAKKTKRKSKKTKKASRKTKKSKKRVKKTSRKTKRTKRASKKRKKRVAKKRRGRKNKKVGRKRKPISRKKNMSKRRKARKGKRKNPYIEATKHDATGKIKQESDKWYEDKTITAKTNRLTKLGEKRPAASFDEKNKIDAEMIKIKESLEKSVKTKYDAEMFAEKLKAAGWGLVIRSNSYKNRFKKAAAAKKKKTAAKKKAAAKKKKATAKKKKAAKKRAKSTRKSKGSKRRSRRSSKRGVRASVGAGKRSTSGKIRANYKLGRGQSARKTVKKGRRKYSLTLKRKNPIFGGFMRRNPFALKQLVPISLKKTPGDTSTFDLKDVGIFALGGFTYSIAEGTMRKIPYLGDALTKSKAFLAANDPTGFAYTVGGVISPLALTGLLNVAANMIPGIPEKVKDIVHEVQKATVAAALISIGANLTAKWFPGLMSGVQFTPLAGVDYTPRLSGVDFTPRMSGHPQLGSSADFGSSDFGPGGYTDRSRFSPADFGREYDAEGNYDEESALESLGAEGQCG